jgi:RNA polymerase sigma factor (sigma-70 family)
MVVDKDILTGCKNKDRRSQFKLYEFCYPYLMNIGLRYRRESEHAAAAVNIAFLKILNNIQNYNETLSFKAWIRRIMVNTLIDEFRKTRKETLLVSHKEYEHEMSINGIHVDYNMGENDLNVEQLTTYIHQLNPLTANVFNLFVLDGYSHKDIGDLLQVTEAASKWHLFTARKQLQEMVLQHHKNQKPTLVEHSTPSNYKIRSYEK